MKFTDQTGFTIELDKPPMRIISLVPSQSELIWDLGKSDALVGITKFCIHPEKMHQSIVRIGGTKQLDIEKIRNLQPDLIIGNKEENEKAQIEELRKEFVVWMSDIFDLKDALRMIEEVGKLINKPNESFTLIKEIKNEFDNIDRAIFAGKRVAYLMWYNPIMVAAGNTFINSMLLQMGCENVFLNRNRYPAIELSDIVAAKPDLIFLSSEPFPFTQVHQEEIRKKCPIAEIIFVDGEMFSWYGSRLKQAPNYFRSLGN